MRVGRLERGGERAAGPVGHIVDCCRGGRLVRGRWLGVAGRPPVAARRVAASRPQRRRRDPRELVEPRLRGAALGIVALEVAVDDAEQARRQREQLRGRCQLDQRDRGVVDVSPRTLDADAAPPRPGGATAVEVRLGDAQLQQHVAIPVAPRLVLRATRVGRRRHRVPGGAPHPPVGPAVAPSPLVTARSIPAAARGWRPRLGVRLAGEGDLVGDGAEVVDRRLGPDLPAAPPQTGPQGGGPGLAARRRSVVAHPLGRHRPSLRSVARTVQRGAVCGKEPHAGQTRRRWSRRARRRRRLSREGGRSARRPAIRRTGGGSAAPAGPPVGWPRRAPP